jgi:hypothetical protein
VNSLTDRFQWAKCLIPSRALAELSNANSHTSISAC